VEYFLLDKQLFTSFFFAFWQGAEIKRLGLVVPVRIRSQVRLIDSNYEELAWRITGGVFAILVSKLSECIKCDCVTAARTANAERSNGGVARKSHCAVWRAKYLLAMCEHNNCQRAARTYDVSHM